jgi:hypothetical protein
VPGLGTSFPFRINENVWADAARVAATGFFNQRSGIDLKAPYTRRPMKRTMHPADGFVVHKTDPAIFFDETRFTGGGNAFKRIQASILEDQTEPERLGRLARRRRLRPFHSAARSHARRSRHARRV